MEAYLIFRLVRFQKNGTVLVCAYAFKYENGTCEKVINEGRNEVLDVILRINYSPVFYDDEDNRLYLYGQNYKSKSGTIFSFDHESISIPRTNNTYNR